MLKAESAMSVQKHIVFLQKQSSNQRKQIKNKLYNVSNYV